MSNTVPPKIARYIGDDVIKQREMIRGSIPVTELADLIHAHLLETS